MQRAEHVAVLVDHALAVAKQEAVSLIARVKKLGVGPVLGAEPGVVDLEAVLGQVQADGARGLVDPLLAADQDRRAEAVVAPGEGGTDASSPPRPRRTPPAWAARLHPVDDQLHAARGRVEAGAQLVAVAFGIDDRVAGDAALHGRPRDRRGHGNDQARIERRRDQIVRTVAQPAAAVGRADLVRHILAGERCDRVGGGDLHGVVDRGRADIERTPEDVGKAQDVVDLIGIVRAAGCRDRIRAHLLDRLGRDLRIGVGHGENDRLPGHALDHVLADRVLGRKAEERVRAGHRLGEAARVGVDRMGRFPLVHAGFAAAIDDAASVAEDGVVVREAHRLQELDAGDRRGPRAVDHQLRLLQRATGDVKGVDQAGRGDDRRAVLIVVEHRDVHQLAQALLDDEAAGRPDVLEIDPAEGRAEQAHAVDEGVDVLGVDLEVDRVDVGEALEQDRFALHHRLGGERAEIAEAEHRRAVRDHRHEIALGGVLEDLVRVLPDREAGCGDARRVGEREIALRGQRLGRRDLDLAGPAAAMQLERLLVGDVVAAILGGGAVQWLVHRCISPPGALDAPGVPSGLAAEIPA